MGTDALRIGTRRELFVDGNLIEETRGGAALRLHSPTPREVSLPMDQPWETGGYITVFRDGDRYRMYYKGYSMRDVPGELERAFGVDDIAVCYAESPDGIHWERPSLGLVEFRGSKDNNILWLGKASHGLSPFRDTRPGCPPEERYKAFGRSKYVDKSGPPGEQYFRMLFALVSPDGVHWSIKPGPKMHGCIMDRDDGFFDSQNLGFWDEAIGAYRMYFRDRREVPVHPASAYGDDGDGGINRKPIVREIATGTSEDFIHWSEPRQLRYPGAPDEELYTNQIIRYPRAPHLYFGFPTRYVEGRGALTEWHRRKEQETPGRFYTSYTDGLFMSSRDGVTFHRWGEAFLRPDMPEESRWAYGECYQNWGIVETPAEVAGAPDELSFYVNEGRRHATDTAIRRHTLRPDGFVSVNAPLSGGEIVTRPLVFEGQRLLLNMSTSAAGSVRVEMQDPDGAPLPGFALDDCAPHFGNTLDRQVRWRDPAAPLPAGRPVRLRFALSDADLYAFRFGGG